MGNYQGPDFYINHTPFWIDKRRTYFSDPYELSEDYIKECKKWDVEFEIVSIVTYEEDYD